MIFIGMSDRTSGMIRGKQIAERSGGRFLDVRDDMSNVRNETVIFVRSYYAGLAADLRRRGNRIGYDLLDRPVADQHMLLKTIPGKQLDWSTYVRDHHDLDFYIVNNTPCQDELRKHTPKPIHIVPHHTVNFASERNKPIDVESDEITIGYVGLEDQLDLGRSFFDSLVYNGRVKLVKGHPTTREGVVDLIKKIDIGIIFIERSERAESILRWKPNTKLSNFQSFGVPTIACGYSSFEQFGGASWLRADTQEQLIAHVQHLIHPDSQSDRNKLREASMMIGDRYHIDRVIADCYNQIEVSNV